MNVQAEWQNRFTAQDFHRSQPSSRTGTPSLAAVVAAHNTAHSPSRDGGSDDEKTDIKGEIESSMNGSTGDSSKIYLSQQRNDLLALQQQHQTSYYTASTPLPRLSSPNCKP
jgi:hypothetical protein